MIRRSPPSPLPLRAATSLLLALAASAGARAEGTPAVEKPAADASAAVAQEIPAAGETPNGAAPGPLPLAGAGAPPAKPAEPPKRAKDEIHGLLNLGASLTERGDYAAAEIAIRQVLDAPEAGPTETKTALLELARMHRRQGALTKAAAIYERYLKDYSGDERVPDALLELGRTLRDLGVYKMAVTCFYNVINSTLKLPADEGFDHYEISNFARNGHVSRHNLGYWRGQDYLGLGTGAWGTVTLEGARLRYRNTPSPERYQAARWERPFSVEGDACSVLEPLDAETSLRERIMLGLRVAEGVDLNAAGRELGVDPFTPERRAAVERALRRGHLEETGGRFRIPRQRWLLADGIITDLL